MRAKPLTPSSEFIKLDFPTLERPMKAISGLASVGQSLSWKALFRNSALVTFILQPAKDSPQITQIMETEPNELLV